MYVDLNITGVFCAISEKEVPVSPNVKEMWLWEILTFLIEN